MEYFCNTGDDIWSKTDGELAALAADELVKIGFIARDGVLDSTVIRVKKAYPAYFGAYESFPKIKDFLSGIGNLYLIGRNGTHRYNNMDHSMPAFADITGVVNDADLGVPAVGAVVNAVDATDHAIYSATADAGGTYTITIPAASQSHNFYVTVGSYSTMESFVISDMEQ